MLDEEQGGPLLTSQELEEDEFAEGPHSLEAPVPVVKRPSSSSQKVCMFGLLRLDAGMVTLQLISDPNDPIDVLCLLNS